MSMKKLSIREVRKELAQLDELIRREGEVVITRRGKPIARLLPISGPIAPPSHAALRAAMPRLKVGSEVHVRHERDER
jgi:prevent-host-death family protein